MHFHAYSSVGVLFGGCYDPIGELTSYTWTIDGDVITVSGEVELRSLVMP
jgi:hypothetical protein